MNKFTILDVDDLKLILRQELEILQKSEESNTFAKGEEVPKVLSKWEEETGQSVATFRKYIRQGVLPLRKMTGTGLLFLYPSDIKKVLEEPKYR